jgi:K+-transporting ATPase ATPase C chain
MTLRRDIITSAIGILVLTLVLGILYPLVITGVGQVAFPGNANGQKVYVGGTLVGSKIIGQQFADVVTNPKTGKPKLDANGNPVTTPDPHYFQSRPSGTTPPDNAAATAFANYGPNSVVTEQALKANIAAYIALDTAPSGRPYYPGGLTAATTPVDAADTSASGIDPEISTANADIQAYRIAAVRHLPMSTVRRLISTYTLQRGIGFSGEPGVDVLELNLALNRLSPSTR